MYLQQKPMYHTWEDLWTKSYQSQYFMANNTTVDENSDWSLSERQLFTQSNGRTLLGQDTKGRLHFVSTPHEKIYAVPSREEDLGGQFRGNIGQYYQNDVALFLSKMNYEVVLSNGASYAAAGPSAVTTYLDDYLPVTKTVRPQFETKIFSIAPVLEPEALQESSIHPLPGPSAVYYCVEIKNTTGVPLKGEVRLSFDQKFVNQFEKYGEKVEDYANTPTGSRIEQRLLMLWDTETQVAIQMLSGDVSGNADNPLIKAELNLQPGESRVFSSIIAVAPEREQIHESLGIMYQHTALEWINVTSDFWHKRLGSLHISDTKSEIKGNKYRDMQVRFMIDNFNCLAFDRKGNLLTNSQGAPSHSLSRSWGIDIVPDVVSVMYVVPEVGPKAIEYLLKRHAPRYSIYPDHSTFFYIAPLVIAQKYLELTGNTGYFLEHPKVVQEIKELFNGLMSFKNPDKALFSSHYASDLLVFRKYDYGLNVQAYYALKGYQHILQIVGEETKEVDQMLQDMPTDIEQTMIGAGPFGEQITGGTNLDEPNLEDFYISEDTAYYAGEDTSSVLAPLYGLYEFNYRPYVNYHRYAQSMFIAAYDPEFQILRELPYGMHPSATGYTVRLGGSFTQDDMRKNLDLLYSRLDESGSLFWWPQGSNKKRCLTRCSQGQGQWVQQSVEQWLGLRLDSNQHVLHVKPQGLIQDYDWTDGQLGGMRFDISYHETAKETVLTIKNNNPESFTIVLTPRPFGAGAEQTENSVTFIIAPGETIEKKQVVSNYQVSDFNVVEKELNYFNDDLEFGAYGVVMPKVSEYDSSAFMLRFVVAHGGDDWQDVSVELETDEQWQVANKGFYEWNYQPIYHTNYATNTIDTLPANQHGVIGFYINLPEKFVGDQKSIMLSEHPFHWEPGRETVAQSLYVKGDSNETFAPIHATLKIANKVVQDLVIPVKVLSSQDYQSVFERMCQKNIN